MILHDAPTMNKVGANGGISENLCAAQFFAAKYSVI